MSTPSTSGELRAGPTKPRSISVSERASRLKTRSLASSSPNRPATASQARAAAAMASRSSLTCEKAATSCAEVIVYSERPRKSTRSTTPKGSSRPPQRDFVRRTPLTTASSRPSSRLNRLTMRSASPSGRLERMMPRAFS